MEILQVFQNSRQPYDRPCFQFQIDIHYNFIPGRALEKAYTGSSRDLIKISLIATVVYCLLTSTVRDKCPNQREESSHVVQPSPLSDQVCRPSCRRQGLPLSWLSIDTLRRHCHFGLLFQEETLAADDEQERERDETRRTQPSQQKARRHAGTIIRPPADEGVAEVG